MTRYIEYFLNIWTFNNGNLPSSIFSPKCKIHLPKQPKLLIFWHFAEIWPILVTLNWIKQSIWRPSKFDSQKMLLLLVLRIYADLDIQRFLPKNSCRYLRPNKTGLNSSDAQLNRCKTHITFWNASFDINQSISAPFDACSKWLISVTRLLDYLSNIWPFATLKMYPKA